MSASISRSEFLSSLPRWRRWLAKLNWHPTVDAQIRSHESKQSELENRRLELVFKKRSQQLENEIAQLKESNARIARFEQELYSSSSPASSTGDSSPT